MSDFMVIYFVLWPDISSIVASMPNLRFTILGGGGWVVRGKENNANSAQLGLKTKLDNIIICLNIVMYGFAKDIKPLRFH